MEYLAADCAKFSSGNGENFDYSCSYNGGVHFPVDDLLDFPKEDEAMTDAFFDNLTGNSGDSSTVTAVESSNSSVSGGGNDHLIGSGSCRSFNESQLSGNDLCVPYDDLPELEWLSNFVEESFSTDDLRFIPTTTSSVAKSSAGDASSSTTITNSPHSAPTIPSDVSVPGKARSKRSRAAPCDWSSRLLHLSASKPAPPKRREPAEATGRKCLHCGSEKTPQWRSGPMGPKTLCNACGVRYKSGRLVPEYRPAGSPSFVSAKHSNSHRKVLELRTQKDLQRQQQQQQVISQALVFNGYDEFLIQRPQFAAHDLGYDYTV